MGDNPLQRTGTRTGPLFRLPSNQVASDFNGRITEIGMVFQNFDLCPHLGVPDNVMMAPLYHRRGERSVIWQKALAALRKVDMHIHAHEFPHQLSGEQQQRVAIAWALTMEPRIMLFDEPTSALDPELVNEVVRAIETLAAEGMTMVIVTHEMRVARKISDRIVFTENGAMASKGDPEAVFGRTDTQRAIGLGARRAYNWRRRRPSIVSRPLAGALRTAGR